MPTSDLLLACRTALVPGLPTRVYDVFFSYRTNKTARALPVLGALAVAGVTVWRDLTHIRAGDSITDEVAAGIASSRALLVFATEDWPKSDLCVAELIQAWIAAERLHTQDPTSDIAPPKNPAARRILLLKPHDLESLDHIRFGTLADCRAFDLPADPAALPDLAQQIKAHLDSLDSRPLGDAGRDSSPAWIPRSAPTSNRFVGRARELWDLHAKLTSSRFVAITGTQIRDTTQLRGLGGLGKTLLASHYAHTFAASWPGGIFWLSVDPSWVTGPDTDESLRHRTYALLDRLADALGVVPVPGDLRATAVAVRQAIAERTAGKPYLWILDNLPPGTSQPALEALAPPTPNGALLVTTRYMGLEAAGERLDLTVLDADAAFTLLTWRNKPKTPEEVAAAHALAADVGHHPLALDVLAALVDRDTSPAPYAHWRTRLAAPGDTAFDTRADALQEQLPTGCARSITRVLEVSLEALASDLAVDVLRITAQLADAPIPASFLVDVLANVPAATPWRRRHRRIRGVTRDQIEMALDALSAHALVTREEGSQSISAHNLVRWVAERWRPERACLPERVDRSCLRVAARIALLKSFPSLEDPRTHSGFIRLLPHALRVAHDTDHSAAELCIRLGDFFRVQGDDLSALTQESHAFTTRLKQLGPSQHPTRIAQQRMADTLHALKRNTEALQHLRSLESSILSDSMMTNKGRDMLLNVRHHIGAIFATDGDLAGATRTLTEVLDQRRLLLGLEHPHTLVTQQALADAYIRLNRHHEAQLLLEQTLAAMTRVNGPTHHDTVITQSTLGRCLAKTGDLPRAIALWRQSLTDLESVHGLDHRSTLAAYNNLAALVMEQGDLEEARQLYITCLDHMRSHLGPTQPDTLLTAYSLACLLHKTGDLPQARSLLREVLLAQLDANSHESEESVRTRTELAGVEISAGNGHDAEEHLSAVLASQTRALGRNHPHTLVTLINLAAAHRLAGKAQLARELLTEALSRPVPPTSDAMVLCRCNLAALLAEDDPVAALEHIAMLERWRDEGSISNRSEAHALALTKLVSLRAFCEERSPNQLDKGQAGP